MLASQLRFSLTTAALLTALSSVIVACGGSSTGGGGGSDGCGECFRAVSCVKACGEEPVQVGCCGCPEGTFDDWQCGSDAGGGG